MGLVGRIKSYVVECKRVLKLTKKPSKSEFKTIVKVTALGMTIIGLIGFAIQMMVTVGTRGI